MPGVPITDRQVRRYMEQRRLGVAERALVFDLKQVKSYLHDDAIKTAVPARVAEQMSGEPR